MTPEDYKKEITTKMKKTFGKKSVRVGTHTDMDGLTSLFLFSCKYTIEDYFFATAFGNVTSSDKSIIADVILDMVPNDKTWEGLVIDHHPTHPEVPRYQLILGEVPAALMVYYAVKDDLLDEDKWKVIIGVAGDGRPELVPTEIWDQYPSLMREHTVTIRDYGQKTYVNTFPLWMQLSSSLNAATRVGKPTVAFDILMKAQNPYEIVNNPHLRDMKQSVNNEVKRVKDQYRGLKMGPIVYFEYESSYIIGSLLAYAIESKQRCPVVVLNRTHNNASIRGAQTQWLVDKLAARGFTVGGHPGYAGLTLKTKTTSELKKALREIGYNL